MEETKTPEVQTAPTAETQEAAKEQTATETKAQPAAQEKTAAQTVPETAEQPPVQEAPAAPAVDVEAVQAENCALRAGVKPEYAADAVILARSYVKDGVTLEQAMTEIIKKYPAFKGGEVPKITASVPISNDQSGTSAEEDAKINRIMGIK